MATNSESQLPKGITQGVTECEGLIKSVNSNCNENDMKKLNDRLQFDASHLGRRDFDTFMQALNQQLAHDHLPPFDITVAKVPDTLYGAESISYSINGKKIEPINLPEEDKRGSDMNADMNLFRERDFIKYNGYKPDYAEFNPDNYLLPKKDTTK